MVRKQNDVRTINKKVFKLNRYWQFDDCEELVHNLYFEDKNYY